MTDLIVVDAFGRSLAALPEPAPSPGRRPAARAALLAVATAVAVALTGLLGGGDRGGALAVERAAGAIEVRLLDATARPADLTRELRTAGVDAVVLVAPATPAAVGTWVSVRAQRVIAPRQDSARHDPIDERPEAAAERARLRGVAVRGDRVLIPAGHPHPLQLVAGVAPTAGQRPVYGP